jgi:hypothetical protein
MRRSFVTVGFAVLVGASIVQAQTQQQDPPASQTPAAAAPAQAPAEDALRFKTADAAAIIFGVKPEATADFEAAYKAMFAQMLITTKPGMKELAGTMQLNKLATPSQAGQPVIYVMYVQNPSREFSYHYGKILFYSGKDPGKEYDGIFEKQEDATPIYQKLLASIANITPWPLMKLGG